MKISVIITNFNEVNALKQNLPFVFKNSPEADEFVFADDCSTDKSVEYLRSLQEKNKKITKIIVHKSNLGFQASSNSAVKAATGDIVVLLNNDMIPQPGYLKYSIKHFQDPEVFGVSFAEKGNENHPHLYWSNGFFQFERSLSQKTCLTPWVSGGGSIVRRDLFLKLGGFDRVYSPAYFEDLDLGYRAWKSGYKLLWEPDSVIIHNHGMSYGKFPKRYMLKIKERNHLLTVLRNVTDKSLLRQNKLFQILRVLTGPNYLKVIIAAYQQLKKYPPAIYADKKTDKELISFFTGLK